MGGQNVFSGQVVSINGGFALVEDHAGGRYSIPVQGTEARQVNLLALLCAGIT